MKLTDTMLVVLSAASQRRDHGVEPPANLKGIAATRLFARLLDATLIEEVRARGALPVWRRDEDGQPMALRITKVGLQAIRVETAEECVIDDTANRANKKRARGEAHTKDSRPPQVRSQRHVAEAAPATPPHGDNVESKQARVIAMLRRPEGATVSAIMEVTGWQPHSVRGFFAGAVRKRLGFPLLSEKEGDERVYRIPSARQPDAADDDNRVAA